MGVPKTLSKNIGDLRNLNKTGYYWVKVTITSEWSVAFYQSHLKKWSYIGVAVYDNAYQVPPAVVNWNKVGMFEGKISKSKAIYNALNELNVGETFLREELIALLWGGDDYFIRRSFSVMFTAARKKIKEDDAEAKKEPREFQTRLGTISRSA